MKKISVLVMMSFVFATMVATSAFAQTPSAVGKIGWLDTSAFSVDGGILKYINAQKQIEVELKPRVTELLALQAKLKTISDDLTKMGSNPAVPADPKAAAAKQDEGQRLQRELEFKKKEYDAALDRRGSELLGPISADILKGVQEYAKQKGFVAVLDIAMLDQSHAILALDPTADITKEFITFYNARPATTATRAVPK